MLVSDSYGGQESKSERYQTEKSHARNSLKCEYFAQEHFTREQVFFFLGG